MRKDEQYELLLHIPKISSLGGAFDKIDRHQKKAYI